MKPPKEKPFDALRAQLTYANEQTAIYKNKAASEEMRAEKLLAANERLSADHSRILERFGVELGKVELREAALVQLALRIAPYGDPVAPELGLVASVAPQARFRGEK